MQEEARSDAQLLWDDALTLLEQDDGGTINAALLAMLRSCVPTDIDETTLHLTCSGGFVAKRVGEYREIIERYVSEAAFQPISIKLVSSLDTRKRSTGITNVVSRQEFEEIGGASRKREETQDPHTFEKTSAPASPSVSARRANPLIDATFTPNNKFTFARFVEGEGNALALQAAKQVANGGTRAYNPLYIYGNSGLGKTHLLRAIQGYIFENDPERTCIYKTGNDFVSDFIGALRESGQGDRSAVDRLDKNYRDVDVLIIDDLQQMTNAQSSLDFFFGIFNSLGDRRKQIVLAADRSPAGLRIEKMDERLTSRFEAGLTLSIQAPNYEMKYALISNFCDQMRKDARQDGIDDLDALISPEMIRIMADRAGNNIRSIEGFCHMCLMRAHQSEAEGFSLTENDIVRIAREKWPTGQRIITVEQVQRSVEAYYGISHNDLIGDKRSKEFMEPRHVGIWLTRELTDNTLADIGKKFGGRTHATVKHSISKIDIQQRDDRLLKDRIEIIKEKIVDPEE